jgi:flavodoxin
MNVEVVYYSRMGSTRKVAEAIASVFGVKAKDCRHAKAGNFDLIFIGSGIYMGSPGKAIVKFIRSLDGASGRKAALFATFGDNLKPIEQLKPLLEEKGLSVVGEWGCKGRFLFSNKDRPNQEDIGDAKEFAASLR